MFPTIHNWVDRKNGLSVYSSMCVMDLPLYCRVEFLSTRFSFGHSILDLMIGDILSRWITPLLFFGQSSYI
jgi:hypothetical protein